MIRHELPEWLSVSTRELSLALKILRAVWFFRKKAGNSHARIRGALMLVALGLASTARGAPRDISFLQSAQVVQAYDFMEVTISLNGPDAPNPFVDVMVSGAFGSAEQPQVIVDGFCDSADGRLYRIRFMPPSPGEYSYSVNFQQGDYRKEHRGGFRAVNANRRGIVRVDPDYPFHFIWEGTGEHYFYNGTTAFFMMGWREDAVVNEIIDRLSRLKINRIRAMLAARTSQFWGEPIIPNKDFQICLNPWIAQRPENVTNPGFDYSRFNLSYWQKWDRMMRYAWAKDMILSVVLDWNDSKVHPAAGGPDELRYFRYAVARLSAYSNLNWDLGDDITAYHDDQWAHLVGPLIKKWDPYRHLITDHPNSDREPLDRVSEWMDFTSFQEWRRPLHGWMLAQRQKQAKLGRIIPQTDEEYGYEDHYPDGSSYGFPDLHSADGNRRAAWEIAMAGTYQTTGETAKRGTGVWPDTGGGWINGRGDDTMVMLNGYAHMVDFFTGFEWWKTEPHDDLVDGGAYCLAEPGKIYVVYMPRGGRVTIDLVPGRYQATWLNPRSGQRVPHSVAEGQKWTSSPTPDLGDWVLYLQRIGAPRPAAAAGGGGR